MSSALIESWHVADFLASFERAWNRGNLEAACEAYAPDVLWFAPGEYVRSKERLVARFRDKYPDRSAMGKLDLSLSTFRTHEQGSAVAVVSWLQTDTHGKEEHGLSVLHIHRFADEKMVGGRLLITEETTM